mmetsp:Transcript_27115/g.68092  ORF Transcript_27115/g.68092 Transcript_27115/m.68092 type:complete len:607 (-) Transcript_27115:144-1964(-)|eukprot:CAMPEP_0177648062 /NCGR_PEP_ID=MMETSP0447-20121125/10630_1 /TAXON_ID=0 /ORGANISM="Stygamoeba regulata, Strain BSH-02190019" /LENGTH=606 /DNA_ID=CAMNT_0019150683 /DNA_START=267 /DNA_END=2087 /DNA_ORIENTATION=-
MCEAVDRHVHLSLKVPSRESGEVHVSGGGGHGKKGTSSKGCESSADSGDTKLTVSGGSLKKWSVSSDEVRRTRSVSAPPRKASQNVPQPEVKIADPPTRTPLVVENDSPAQLDSPQLERSADSLRSTSQPSLVKVKAALKIKSRDGLDELHRDLHPEPRRQSAHSSGMERRKANQWTSPQAFVPAGQTLPNFDDSDDKKRRFNIVESVRSSLASRLKTNEKVVESPRKQHHPHLRLSPSASTSTASEFSSLSSRESVVLEERDRAGCSLAFSFADFCTQKGHLVYPPIMRVMSKREFDQAWSDIFDVVQSSCLLQTLEVLVAEDLEGVDDIHLFLRRNENGCIFLMRTVERVGKRYAWDVIQMLLSLLGGSPSSPVPALEVDPNVLVNTGLTPLEAAKEATKTSAMLQQAINALFEFIVESASVMPRELLEILQLLHRVSQDGKGDSEKTFSVGLRNLFFLRFLCSAIVNPEANEFFKAAQPEPLTSKQKRTFLIVSKVLQGLASGCEFKEQTMKPFNVLIQSSTEALEKFRKTIPHHPLPEHRLPFSKIPPTAVLGRTRSLLTSHFDAFWTALSARPEQMCELEMVVRQAAVFSLCFFSHDDDPR